MTNVSYLFEPSLGCPGGGTRDNTKGEKGAGHAQGFQISLTSRAVEIAFSGGGSVVNQLSAPAQHQVKQVQDARAGMILR